MTGSSLWLNLLVCLVSLLAFGFLALASERQGEALLQRAPTPRERLRWRLIGWPLLALALALCIQGWGWSIGIVAWLGWLCMAGAALAFALPRWTEKPSNKKPLPSPLQTPRSRTWRKLAWVLLMACPVAFAWALHGVPVKPVARADAVHGQVGPWFFALAELDHDAPKHVVRDIFTKSFQLRFCTPCDAEIRSAYFRVNKPRSLRSAGLAFNGARWDRSVEIQLPGNTHADSELWLTVEGKDGTVHQTTVRLADIAPSTAQWFKQYPASPEGKSNHATN